MNQNGRHKESKPLAVALAAALLFSWGVAPWAEAAALGVNFSWEGKGGGENMFLVNPLKVYEETAEGRMRKTVLMDDSSGAVKAVMEVMKGKTVVTVFTKEAVAQVEAGLGEGVTVKEFSKMKVGEQEDLMAGLAVMDRRDTSLVTEKLVKIQESLAQAKLAKMAESLEAAGIKVDGDRLIFKLEI